MLLRRIARPLFASWFLAEGLDAVRHPAAHAEVAREAVSAAAGQVPAGALGGVLDRYRDPSTRQTYTLVQVHGTATAAAAVLLAVGKAPRVAALALAALTLPIAAANLPKPSRGLTPEVRKERRARFVRTLAFSGGALLAAADREGRPGLTWRLEKARDERLHAAHELAASVAAGAEAVSSRAAHTVRGAAGR